MENARITVRAWLMENGYPGVAEMIDEIQAEWKINGKRTRRNWWDVLSGGKNGFPRTIYGRQFPVLQAAQIRQGKPITQNALKILVDEKAAPTVFDSGRWKKTSVNDISLEEEVAAK